MTTYKETLKRIMNADYDNASEEEKREAVEQAIQVCSVAAAAVAVQPVPLVDTMLISPIQIAMVQAIGRIRGHRLDKKSVLEILGVFGASLIAQNAIMAAAKLIPVLGWLVTISMAYAMTYAVGEVSDHYFVNGRGETPDELKAMFKKIYTAKRQEKVSANEDNQSLREKLEELNEAYDEGLLDEQTFNTKKEEVLRGF